MSPSPLTVACPACGAAQGAPCTTATKTPRPPHPSRVKRATAGLCATGCHCTNHLGHPKQQHRTRQAAVQWATRNARHGMRLEPYHCPTSDRWHIRTARTRR